MPQNKKAEVCRYQRYNSYQWPLQNVKRERKLVVVYQMVEQVFYRQHALMLLCRPFQDIYKKVINITDLQIQQPSKQFMILQSQEILMSRIYIERKERRSFKYVYQHNNETEFFLYNIFNATTVHRGRRIQLYQPIQALLQLLKDQQCFNIRQNAFYWLRVPKRLQFEWRQPSLTRFIVELFASKRTW